MNIDPKFKGLLDPADLRRLDAWPQTVYAVWEDYTLAFANEAWYRFAAENGAPDSFFDRWKIGSSLEDVFTVPAAIQFRVAMELALATNHPTFWLYECSSPANYRLMHGAIQPLIGHGRRACLLHNSLVVEAPHADAGPDNLTSFERWTGENRLIAMCSGCRRVRVADTDVWERVASLVADQPENTTHTFCPGCFSWYGAPMHVQHDCA